jgi:hypothetical protein
MVTRGNKGYGLRSRSMPHFMLRELLGQQPQPQLPANASEHQDDSISILSFSLIPGGICRDAQSRDDAVNRRLSGTILESVRLLLAASLNHNGKNDATGTIVSPSGEDTVSIRYLMEAIALSMERSDVIAGGTFPHLVAQKALA